MTQTIDPTKTIDRIVEDDDSCWLREVPEVRHYQELSHPEALPEEASFKVKDITNRVLDALKGLGVVVPKDLTIRELEVDPATYGYNNPGLSLHEVLITYSLPNGDSRVELGMQFGSNEMILPYLYSSIAFRIYTRFPSVVLKGGSECGHEGMKGVWKTVEVDFEGKHQIAAREFVPYYKKSNVVLDTSSRYLTDSQKRVNSMYNSAPSSFAETKAREAEHQLDKAFTMWKEYLTHVFG